MKHQFKFNPLATAIFTLLCGSSITSYAESTPAAPLLDNQQLKQSLNESYPGQTFFEQYYFDKTSPEVQQRHGKSLAAAYCQGAWVTPIGSNTQGIDPNNTTSTLTADYGHYNPQGDSVLEGNVIINQQGREIRADKITIDQTQTFANAEGRVQLAQAGLLSQSNQIRYNLKTQQGDLNNSYYIAEQQHAYGYAEKIAKTSDNVVVFNNASYSTCPPQEKPTWRIQAEEIALNRDTGRGETRGTKLYIKDTPVLAVPYFNFPIDDRRTTGLLTPSFGYTSDGGPEISLPIYLNLAANYDAIITPRYLGSRGAMLEGEFRYLTENLGEGRLLGGYLSSDEDYDGDDRKYLNFNHLWQINNQFSTKLEYNYASDKDVFTDLDNNPNSKTDLNLRRAWELNYRNGIPGLKAQLKVEDFQTLDKTILDEDRPYARLPQLLVNYKGGNPQGLQYEFNNDTAYFQKNIATINGVTAEPSGTRLYNDFALRYNYRTPWSFILPEVSIRNVNTFYDQDTKNAQSHTQSSSENQSVTVPQLSVDAGLTFEKEGTFLQTLTPRVFYAYAPYEDQNGLPNFDSVNASISYDQLFSSRRFYGNDRLEDNNFASLGLSYSLFDEIGLERIKASVGQSFFFEDRRVSLNNKTDDMDREDRTGPVVSLASQLSENVIMSANSAWMSNGKNAQRDLQMFYNDDRGQLYNIGYFYRQNIHDRQESYDQISASFIQPISEQWRILGHAQYDLDNNVAREFLLGINYESCCWGVSVYGRSYYNDLDDVNAADAKPKRAVMAEFSLKGLGGFNNKLVSLMQNRILGFDKSHQSWTQR